MYDWDGNGKIDPYDVGQSVSMGLYNEEEQKNTYKKSPPTGCMTGLIAITIVLLGIFKIY